MGSLINERRPAAYCPGCSHHKVLQSLDRALTGMGCRGHEVVIVTDIGCSGLFDTFFNTHAFHGLHGRALTYAAGIKMARPRLKVIVTMGDGGLGIGGAHVLSACRRNIDLTLLVLNNFNYGMTGGQCSSTTPQNATVGSGFLNRLERPIDICHVAGAAGAPMVARVSTYQEDIVERLQEAIGFDGFALMDIHGICPGRYTRRNKLTPKAIETDLAALPDLSGYNARNIRAEYSKAYRYHARKLNAPKAPERIRATCRPPQTGRHEIVLLGRAGQRIITAGELLCLAGAAAGCHATQKNDYPITVMKGHSISEVILSDGAIEYPGIEAPCVVIALAPEGVRRREMLTKISPQALIIKSPQVDLPASEATVIEVDFKAHKIKSQDWALAALVILSRLNRVLTPKMLRAALKLRFQPPSLKAAESIAGKVDALWNSLVGGDRL